MKKDKILISGYYGFDNFGDDAILQVLVTELKNSLNEADITVISNNPDKVSKDYKVNSVKRFDFNSIISQMRQSNLFISGGGSLLQDTTSIKSLLYYLSLIFIAQVLRLKTCIFAQGIGPINSRAGRILTKLVLEKVSLITVRDKGSQEFLKKLGIDSTLTADPVWNIESVSHDKDNNKINVGIQLRQWHSLDDIKLKTIADAVNNNFNSSDYKIKLVSLQDSQDLEVTKEFMKYLNPEIDKELIFNLSIKEAVAALGNLDFLIGMRFHADLVALKFNIPTLALSYDPKVESLSKDSGIPYIDINSFSYEEINSKISELVLHKDEICDKIKDFSAKKSQEARQNTDLLIKMLI